MVALAVVGWIYLGRRAEPESEPVREARRAMTRLPGSELASESAGASREDTERLDPNLARPAAGTGEAYLAHVFRSFIVAQEGQIGLSAPEVDRLVSDLLEMYEVQTEVTSRFMREMATDATSVTVHVPPFPAEGKGVRDLLHERLRQDFPQQHERITAEIGPLVDDAFRGFGITDQTIVVRKTETPDTFEVTWNATVVEGQTPSRDPEGVTYGGSSTVTLMARDQIASGELRFLAPLLDRRFASPAGGVR